MKIGNIKIKGKFLKDAEKQMRESESKYAEQSQEMNHLRELLEDKTKKCNELCLKVNEIMDKCD